MLTQTFRTGDAALQSCAREFFGEERFAFIRIVLCNVQRISVDFTPDTFISFVIRGSRAWNTLISDNDISGRTFHYSPPPTIWGVHNLPFGARDNIFKGVRVWTVRSCA